MARSRCRLSWRQQRRRRRRHTPRLARLILVRRQPLRDSWPLPECLGAGGRILPVWLSVTLGYWAGVIRCSLRDGRDGPGESRGSGASLAIARTHGRQHRRLRAGLPLHQGPSLSRRRARDKLLGRVLRLLLVRKGWDLEPRCNRAPGRGKVTLFVVLIAGAVRRNEAGRGSGPGG